MADTTCPVCGKDTNGKVFCSDKCRFDKSNYDENGKFIKRKEDIQKDREIVRKEFGMPSLKDPKEFIRETNEKLLNAGLIQDKELKDAYGFTKEFYAFVGFGIPHSYYHPLQRRIQKKAHDMQRRYRNMKYDSSGEVFSPIDDMYATPGEGDTWYDYGRIPTSHLVALCMGRLGVANTICNRPSVDMFDNDWEWVNRNDPNGDPIKTEATSKMFNWADKVRFNKRLAEAIEFTEQTGNGHLVVSKYLNKEEKAADWSSVQNTRPIEFQTFSAYHMTPINIWKTDEMDYDKNAWAFMGGVHTSAEINPERTFVFTLRRYPYQLRDLALPETCFVSLLCLLNISYYLLKSLAQLGTITVGIQTESIFPTAEEVNYHLTYLEKFKANGLFVMGKGSTLQVENAASKIGQGIPQILEYFKEDVSASAVFPKNQLFGRAEGGGISGAGAIVSKEDYIASNISVKFGMVKRDIKWILQEMCHFKGLDDLIPRMNIDLHKTEQQRLQEALMREQKKQAEMVTKQQELMLPLYKKQLKLQSEMVDIQMKMAKSNPEQLFQISNKDEENTQEKKPAKVKGDFLELKVQLLIKEREYNYNTKILDMLRGDVVKMKKYIAMEDLAQRTYLERERRYGRSD